MKHKDIYTFLLSLKSLSYAENHMLSPLEIAARRVVRNGTVACSKVHGAKDCALLEWCRDREKKSVWRLHVVQHLGMPVHKEQAGVFCLIRDLFPPRTPSALFQALSRHSRLAGNQAWVSGISLSCREDDSQPQAREWMRLFHYSLGGLDLLGRGNGRSGKGLFFFYSLVLSPTGQQLVERSCGQQCSSLVCPMRLRKAFVVHSAMCLRRPRAEANYLGCFSLGW